MASRKVVLFVGEKPYYLSGFRDGPTHMRGMVENGAWNLYIVKDCEYHWMAYTATSRGQCNAANRVSEFNPADVCWVEVPETMLADYNTVINWAKARKETACQRPQV
jgi:hypothetical protein